MIIVSGRDFRANQSKYITEAYNGEDVIITSRVGNVRLVPILQSDVIVNTEEISPELAATIEKARQEFIEGKTLTMSSHEEIDKFFESL